MKIKVCHFTSVHKAGDTRIFVKECRSIAAAGYDVYLIAINEIDRIVDGVNIIGVPFSGGRIKRLLNGAKAVYKKALDLDANIYHFHDPELLPFGAKLASMGKKVIYDTHEDLPRQIVHKHYIPAFLTPLLVPLTENRENHYVKKLSAVIAATPYIRDRFLKVNPLTIDVCNYPSLEELGTPVPFDLKEDQCCYIGSITHARGIVELVNAMAHCTSPLTLGGSFAPASLEKEMRLKEGWKNIRFLGFLKRLEVKTVLDKSKVGILPLHPVRNYADGLPVKLFEYMASGIPVVASNTPSWKPLIEGNDCGVLVDIFNPKEFAKAINELMNDRSRSEALGKNGRRAVEEKYNWTNEEKKLLLLYDRLIS